MRLSPSRRAVVRGAVAIAAAAAVAGAGTASASGGSHRLRWAAPSVASIHPGVLVTMAQVQCRAGFVLTDGRSAYLGMPASCAGVSGGQPTDGCSEAQVPVGVSATVEGARYPGRLVYTSFTRMASIGVTNADECAWNSLALIRLDPRDVARTSPSLPLVGGPSGTSGTSPSAGATLTLYLAMPGQALAIQNGNSGWSHTVVPATAVTAGDVGGPVLDGQGRAVGMLAQVPQSQGGPSGVGDLRREIAFLQRTPGFRHVRLALATTKFTG